MVQSIAIPHGLPFRIAIDRKAARHLTREQGVHVLNMSEKQSAIVFDTPKHRAGMCPYDA